MRPYGVDPLIHDGVFYDAMNTSLGDLDYYDGWCRQAGGEVLELCCGTGRLTIPLAQRGHRMTGLDFTDSMLDSAREKGRAAGVDVRWVKGDMRRLSLGRRFSMIFIPFNSLQNTYTIEDIERIFAGVRAHLEPGGLFLTDLFNPDVNRLVGRDVTPRIWDFHLPDGRRVEIVETCRYDAAGQVNRVLWSFRIEGQESPMDQLLDMRCFFPQEMDALLRYNGWKVLEKFGNYDGSPFTSDSPKQLYVCVPA
ncbi:MAG: class I SAM-dependent methyltransferase [Candidatus Eisenbacteria bacterium]|nr:class I SAM-dependent methyltransferase [Candidatus Eisenbacteria bacterium]